MIRMLRHTMAAAATLVTLAGPALAEFRLLMVHQPGCVYCQRWEAEVGDAYHLTDEGRAAPVLRADIRHALPEGVTLARPAVFTPTFVLLEDGQERARIEGYPGEDFFWGLLAKMLEEAGAPQPAPKS